MLSRHLPDLSAFEVLLAVSRLGSISAASAEVGVSQQAVSSRIASIEAQTGVVLLQRTAQGSSLTPAGVVVAEWAARLVDAAAEVDAGLASMRRDRRARVRVSASPMIAEQLLPGWLLALHGRSDRSDIVLQTAANDTVAEQVRSGSAELGFIDGGTAPKGLRARTIGHDRSVVVVPPEHPWARRRRPLPSAELAQTPLVVLAHARDALSVSMGGGVEPVVVLPTPAAVRAAVIAGAGPAVLSELAVADDLAVGRLTSVEVDGVRSERTLRAVWLGGANPPAGVAQDLLAIALRRSPSR